MHRVCLTCGQHAEEAHHVAGRRNHEVTTWVCVDCHRILSIWQRAHGIELRDVETSEMDATRALLVGAMHLVQLFSQRHADTAWFPNWLVIHSTRAVSKLLDLVQPADRAGRWLPDPTVSSVTATPVELPVRSDAEQLAEIAHLGGALSKILGEIPQLRIATLAEIAKGPWRWMEAFDDAMRDQDYADALLGIVTEYIKLSEAMITHLLQVDDVDQIEEVLLDEVTAWRDCACQLLGEITRITGSAIAVAS